nr:PREDICTED: uncharacterized protein LOC107397628 [Tribolium castaneum]|eukprot:XP_015833911.1 PREDICTED: uncharacterized protein LOC107397628 [Tribolium castaneum]
MIRFFTSHVYEHQIETLDDLVKYNLPCYDYPDIKYLYILSEEMSRYVNKCTIISSENERESLVEEIIKGKKLVTTFRYFHFRGVLHDLRKKGHKNIPVHLTRQIVTFQYGYYYFTKGYPLYHRFREILRRLQASGITTYIRYSYGRQKYASDKKIILEKEEKSDILNADKFSVQFYILVIELHFQILIESSNPFILNTTKTSSRVLAGVALVGFINFSTVYKSEMIRFFTSHVYEHQIETLDDLVKYNLPCYDYPDIKYLYILSEEMSRYVNKCTIIASENERESLVEEIIRGKKLVTTFRYFHFRGVLHDLRKKGHKNIPVHLTRQIVTFQYGYYYFTKGYPLYHRFREILRRLQASGITTYIRYSYGLQKYASDKKIILEKEEKSDILNADKFSVQFYILVIGLVISFVVARFIIIFSNHNPKEIFTQLPKYFIYNTILLDDGHNIYGYDPYKYEDVSAENTTPKLLGPCQHVETFFENKLPKFWRNTTVAALRASLFLHHQKQGRTYDSMFCPQIVQEKLGFRFLIQEGNGRAFGANNETLDALRSRNFSLSINHFLLNEDQHLHFDLVPLHVVHSRLWVVPKATLVPYWKLFLLCFGLSLWLLFAAFFCILTIVWTRFEKNFKTASIILHFQILVENSNAHLLQVTKSSSRVLASVTLIIFLIFSSVYKSEMIRVFTSRVYEHQIETLDDLLEYNLPCYDYPDIKQLYVLSNDMSRYVNKCKVIPSEFERVEILKRILRGEKLVTTFREKYFRGMLRELLKQGYKMLVYLTKETVAFDYGYLYLTKGYPLYDRFVDVYQRLQSAGIMKHYELSFNTVEDKLLYARESSSNVLQSDKFSIQFCILLVGLTVSIVVFITEVLYHRYRK